MTTPQDVHSADIANAGALQEAARRHLWMHFTRMSSYADNDVPIIVRGEGAYVYDSKGRRYLDGLAGLFVSMVGHGRDEIAEAAARQSKELAYFPLWSYAHPRAIELAERLANLAPGDLNRVFFTTGGSEAVESAWKLARQYFRAIGQPSRYKVISRDIPYHAPTMGALIITVAKGMTSGYAPIGAMIASDRIMEPFLKDTSTFLHGITFGGHPVSCAVALANLDVFEKEDLLGHVLSTEDKFRATLSKLNDLPIVGEVRGDGYFYGIELVKDKVTRETFDDAESERLLRGFLSGALFEAGLICRADDRGDPVIQLAPPLIIDQPEFDFIEQTLRSVLTEAWSIL